MNYAMEDTQNSAPGDLPPNQAAKLAPRKGPDAQSTTKRLVQSLLCISNSFTARQNISILTQFYTIVSKPS